jgi:hypothetical protein
VSVRVRTLPRQPGFLASLTDAILWVNCGVRLGCAVEGSRALDGESLEKGFGRVAAEPKELVVSDSPAFREWARNGFEVWVS